MLIGKKARNTIGVKFGFGQIGFDYRVVRPKNNNLFLRIAQNTWGLIATTVSHTSMGGCVSIKLSLLTRKTQRPMIKISNKLFLFLFSAVIFLMMLLNCV